MFTIHCLYSGFPFLIRGMDSSVVTSPATQTCHHRTLVRIPAQPVWCQNLFTNACLIPFGICGRSWCQLGWHINILKKFPRKKLNLSFLIRGMDSSVVTSPATQTCHHRTLVRIPTRPVWFSIFLHICVLDTISHLCGILMPTGLAYQHFKKFQEKKLNYFVILWKIGLKILVSSKIIWKKLYSQKIVLKILVSS